jgi:hypothetical protein
LVANIIIFLQNNKYLCLKNKNMKLVNDFLSKIGTDKVLHFLVGALMVSYSSMISSVFMWLSLLFLLIISIVKETLDDEFSYKDIVAAMIGGIISAIISCIFL